MSTAATSAALRADRQQIWKFVHALFMHADLRCEVEAGCAHAMREANPHVDC